MRIFWVVLDGLGIGALPDAHNLQANTLAHIVDTCPRLQIPTLAALGLKHLCALPPQKPTILPGTTAHGRAMEASPGMDTLTGHWEMAGAISEKPFVTFPNGLPQELLNVWLEACQLPGYIGNTAASGTTILEQYAHESIQTHKPIVYTSADSVWQIAAHEEHFGLTRLYEICEKAHLLSSDYGIARVIARPFLGPPWVRTYRRYDYCIRPPITILNKLEEAGLKTLGIGKIGSIFSEQGITHSHPTAGNKDGLEVLQANVRCDYNLIYCNLIDFDMLYGHRRDARGFGNALEYCDAALASFIDAMALGDGLIITADHGNDPLAPGTDHTREHVPILCLHKNNASGSLDLGTRATFADMGATIFDALTHNQSQGSFAHFFQEAPLCL